MDKQREEFEDWLIKEFELKKHDYALHFVDGEYQCTPTQARWQAWQQAQKVAVPKLSDKVVCVIEREVENQLIASGIDADPFRLDGEKIFNAIIEAGEKK